jgi:mono/diheme cytochrome c family protein
MNFMLMLALLLPWTLASAADESSFALKSAPDEELVRTHCAICHSLDYIQMNSVFLKRQGWEAEVRKMVRVMGAPLTDDEAVRIVDYLTGSYGAN